MKLRTNWHASWSQWTEYQTPRYPSRYRARKRELYVGKLHLATLCQSELRPRLPFYMYSAGAPKLTVHGTSAFEVVRQFMRHLQ